jgi:hypothetical protein
MKTTKVYLGSIVKEIEIDKLQGFLDSGWTEKKQPKTVSKKKTLPKVEITAEAEVTTTIPNDDLEDVEWDIQQLNKEEK